MKKLLAFLPGRLAYFASLLFALLAPNFLCAQTQKAAPPTGAPKQAIAAPATSSAAPWTGDFDGMRKRRFLRALVAYSKTQYYVVNGVQRGTAYDTLKAFEDTINRKYPAKEKSLRFHVIFVPVPRDQLLPRLNAGRGDVAMGALTISPERLKQVDFSDPLATGIKEIAVTGPNTPPLSSLDDLSGKEVFVRKSSAYWENLEGLNKKFKEAGKPAVKLNPAPEDLEDEDLLQMLNSGLIPIVICDAYLPKLWGKIYKNIRANETVVVSDANAIGIAMRKNSPQLAAALNEFVKTHKVGTTFGNMLVSRYVLNATPLGSAVSVVEFKRFEETVQMFQKYSSQYGVDYLLMMAQGFQESALNQNAKSAVGAIGIMQLMPATGQEMKVGDIHQKDANIHAGVKYIRFMVDKYFANEPMDDTNKILFAFAAYNAGPARVRSLRAEAEKKGLNPNVWMNNVELIAAARVGPETVNYVTNIYKYYVAYKLAAKQLEDRKKAMESVKSN